MRKFLFLIAAITLTLQLLGQAQKTYVKSFPNPTQVITISVNGPVEIKEWEQPFIRVLTTVSIENTNSNVLAALMQAGRYQLKTKHTENRMEIYSPTEQDPIKFQGKLLTEQISFVIYVPKHTEVQMKEEKDSITIIQ